MTRFRLLTGRSSTSSITDADVHKRINQYYTKEFPAEAMVDEFDVFVTQALSATDDGIYALSQDIIRFDDPVTINGRQITLVRDRELFFGTNHYTHSHYLHSHHHSTHPHAGGQFSDEQYITEPTLVIGSSDTKKVKHSDFDYSVNDYAYSKLSSEVALTGSAIPTGKYGAWSLKIDTDGDITVAAATDNATGYDTPRLALEALNTSDSDNAYMGYVTVTKSDGAFTPDTTALDASNVTATFTDGKFENRNEPESILLYGGNIYVNPKPNDIYELKALSIQDRPAALDTGDAPSDPKWGSMIAMGAAINFLSEKGNTERLVELSPVAKNLIGSIREDKTKRLLGQVPTRSF
ncbi:MAG: hypothetical protein ACYSUX_00405 [Planctomycetota bacterium]